MRFPFMLMFTTRLVVVARKLKRRVHAFIESIDTCHRDFIEFAYSNSTSGAKVFDVFENWVTSAWCVFRAFGFSFRQLFSPFRSPFFFLLFFISCTNRSNSSLFSKRRGIFCRSFTPLATPHCEHTKLLRETFSLIATASLSLCTWPSFLARILQFKYSNVLLSCSYLCFPRFHIHLPSINHRAIPFIASSLYFSIFTSSSGLHSLFSRLLLLLLAFVPVFRQTEGGGERKKSRIPGQRFQGSVTSLTNWLPRIPSAFLLFHRPSHDSPPTLYASSRKDTGSSLESA